SFSDTREHALAVCDSMRRHLVPLARRHPDGLRPDLPSLLTRSTLGCRSRQARRVLSRKAPFGLLPRTAYAPAAVALPGNVTAPSCCIKPSASQLTNASLILSPWKRQIVIPVPVACRPVGCNPSSGPRCV